MNEAQTERTIELLKETRKLLAAQQGCADKENLGDHELCIAVADHYRPYLEKLMTVQHVDAIPCKERWILRYDLKMIDCHEDVIFLTKNGIMYLQSRGLM